MSSDDEIETLEILYPLPHVNTHERPLIEEVNNRPIVDANNGKVEIYSNGRRSQQEFYQNHLYS